MGAEHRPCATLKGLCNVLPGLIMTDNIFMGSTLVCVVLQTRKWVPPINDVCSHSAWNDQLAKQKILILFIKSINTAELLKTEKVPNRSNEIYVRTPSAVSIIFDMHNNFALRPPGLQLLISFR